MKRKYSIGNFIFGLAVLLAILLQSAHSFHHLEETLSAEKCHHDYSENKTQITHSHHFEHCFVCEFTFSNFINPDFSTYNFPKVEISTSYSFVQSKEITQFFCGSLFALRAPPRFIV